MEIVSNDKIKKTENWTEEKINKYSQKYFNELHKHIEAIRYFYENKNKNYNEEKIFKDVASVLNFYYAFKDADKSYRTIFRDEICKILLNTNIVHELSLIVFEICKIGLLEYFKDDNGTIMPMFQTLKKSIVILFNYSDISDELCNILCKNELFMTTLKDIQSKWKDSHFSGLLNSDMTYTLKYSIALPYNILLRNSSENTQAILNLGMLTTVSPYLDSPTQLIKTAALLFVAFAASDNEANMFQSDPSTLNYLLDLLKISLTDSMGRGKGYSMYELLKVVNRLAKNDANKIGLVENGVVSILNSILKSDCTIDEACESLESLWTLSFTPSNRAIIMKECLNDLQSKWCNHDNEKLRKAAKGAIFVLQGGTEKVDLSKTKDDVKNASSHIMISYNWEYQDVVLKIAKDLRSLNYSLWLDVEQMEGSTLEAMAKAIENSWCVLICYSRKYKESPNCRVEGEYTFTTRKKFFPLLMENKYKPDGWLGLCIGSKFFYDFSGYRPYNKVFDELKRDLQRSSNTTIESPPIDMIVPSSSNQSYENRPISTRTDISNWTCQRVQQWCSENKLDGSKMMSIRGSHLLFLKRLQREAPDFFFRAVEIKLQQISLDDIMRFTEALDRL